MPNTTVVTNRHDCVEITDFCTVDKTIYGYYPSLSANAFFLAFFAACCIVNLTAGIRWKTWTYMIAMTIGCFGEALGFAGRVMMHKNPWDSIGFNIQICCLIIAPAFFSAAIYLTLKHLVLCFGEESSRIAARWYTWIFIMADLLSLVLQGAGGGLAATANDNKSLQNTGNNLMIAGIVWQVVTLFVFGCLAADYYVRRHRSGKPLSVEAETYQNKRTFQLFLGGLVLAYLTIFIRCVYRIAEMSGGWRNKLMQNQTDFIILECVMILVAVACLTAFHPGYCFPRLGNASPVFGSGSGDVEKRTTSETSVEQPSA